MKKIYIYISAFVGLLVFTSCNHTYTRYWHEEEDDVYFTSKTIEEVDVHSIYRELETERDRNSWRGVERRIPRNDRDWEYRQRRRSSNTYYPPVVRSGRTNDSNNSGNTSKSQTPKSTKSPTPSRSGRPSGSRPSSNPK